MMWINKLLCFILIHLFLSSSFNASKVLTKSQPVNNSRRKWVLTNEEKLEFVKTSVSWISSKDKRDSCFILNFGYKASLPWPQV